MKVILKSYLTPSLPQALFTGIADHLRHATGLDVHVRFDTSASGAAPGGDPFGDGSDLAFVCAPTWLWSDVGGGRRAPLLGVAPVFDDPRAAGRPVYFSDVVVRDDDVAGALEALRESRWATNDPCSLSGHLCVVHWLEGRGEATPGGADLLRSGSHLASIDLVTRGAVRAAAIDSNVLAILRRTAPSRVAALRVIATWGPHPIQPLIVHPAMPDRVAGLLRDALLRFAPRPDDARPHDGLIGFGPMQPADFADLDVMLRDVPGTRRALRAASAGGDALGAGA